MKNYGLKPLPKDRRDRSHHRTFGAAAVSLPDEYIVKNIDIDDQGNTQFCTAHSTSECAESQFGLALSPGYSAAKIGQVGGESIAFRGADLRQAMKAGVKYGFLPKLLAPLTLEDGGESYIGDWNHWPAELDNEAAKYRMDGFYAVDGPHDTFDNIRYAIWVAHQDPNDCDRTVEVGSRWYAEWQNVFGSGIIGKIYTIMTGLHAHRVLGWKMINGEPYLVDQQAQGTSFGDKGLCYFPREVVNKEFTEGMFIFRKNPDPNQIKTISKILDLLSQVVSLLAKLIQKR